MYVAGLATLDTSLLSAINNYWLTINNGPAIIYVDNFRINRAQPLWPSIDFLIGKAYSPKEFSTKSQSGLLGFPGQLHTGQRTWFTSTGWYCYVSICLIAIARWAEDKGNHWWYSWLSLGIWRTMTARATERWCSANQVGNHGRIILNVRLYGKPLITRTAIYGPWTPSNQNIVQHT